jgi:hypothetical protein
MNLGADLTGVNCSMDTAGNRNLIAEDTLVPAAGVGQKNWDDKWTVAGGGWLVGGCWIPDDGCWICEFRV